MRPVWSPKSAVTCPFRCLGRQAEQTGRPRALAAKAAIGAAISVDALLPTRRSLMPSFPCHADPSSTTGRPRSTPTGGCAGSGRSAQALDGPVDQYNPIGAMAAASIGCSEVFKRLISLKPERGRPIEALTFSTFSYSCGGMDPGPRLPRDIPVDLGLVGLGAIGNATATLVADLPVSGRALAIDHDFFEDVNLATCLSVGPSDLGSSKAEFTR